MLKVYKNPEKGQWARLLKRPTFDLSHLESSVKNILTRVKSSGDKALTEFTHQFDNVEIKNFEVTPHEIVTAAAELGPTLKEAIQKAYNNIYRFHEAQKKDTLKIDTMEGVTCWRKAVPIQKVGIYIPGGSAPLFSSVLMMGIPAKIAECPEVILCTPPGKDGKVNPAILFTAHLVGIKKIFKVGGAQAIAAMAYGTESIPKVFKIFGPGNQYVTAAKQMVSLGSTAIDMPAGPSEVAILADESSNPEFIAADLLSQAEHGADSQVILISTSEKTVELTNSAIKKQLDTLPRKRIATESLKKSIAIVVENQDVMMEMSNTYAPEHLIITTAGADALTERVVNAGSVFIGSYTPESAGDYASGTNHTLPTNGAAAAYSGISLDSFYKQITYQKITGPGLKQLGPIVEAMAAAEQLIAHKNSISIRLRQLENGDQ